MVCYVLIYSYGVNCMKKLFSVLLAVLMVGCGNVAQQGPAVEESKNLTTVCSYLSGEIKGADNGWYEVMRHSDGTADIVYTDVSAGTRSVFGDARSINVPYGSLSAVFVADGYVYHYFYGFPESMGKEENNSILYQYDTDGKLLQTKVFEAEEKFTIGSAVVSDGENLYFSGYGNEKFNIYTVNQNNLEAQTFYQSDDQFELTGGYKNQLVLFVIKDGKRTMELLDTFTLERKVLFETRFPWYMLDENRLYNYQDQKSVLKTYSLENGRQSDIRLFDKDDCVNNWQIPYSATGGRYLAVYTSQYEGNYEKAYIYDLHTEKLTEVQRFYGKAVPAKIGNQIYYLAPASEQRVFLNSGLTERIDYNYIIVSLENLCDGNGNNIKVENQIEYR